MLGTEFARGFQPSTHDDVLRDVVVRQAGRSRRFGRQRHVGGAIAVKIVEKPAKALGNSFNLCLKIRQNKYVPER
ncbi:hypothetical protein [Xaviernesmea oryzae]|uniref:hypothetical protein n=1 Tax=Xaviernesmea oryzae TaxID=464029 RepID=UPI0011136ADF|nr:hypothetical protein [Xaviernesmea oryzae]